MATISTAIQLNDLVSGPAQHMCNAINMTLGSFQALENGADVNFNAIRSEVAEANAGLKQMEEQLNRNNEATQKVTTGFRGWEKAIIVANQAVGLVKNTLGSLGVLDLGGAFERIDTMDRFQKTVSVMTGDAQAANAALTQLKETTTGTAYGLDVASKAAQGFLTRGMSLGAATDQVRIWADAVSFYGEGTNEQLESVVDAIGKMYSKGTVEADQLDRLFDAGIGAAEIYAGAVGQAVSSVKEDLSKGNISAAQFIDTVSQAMDAGLSSGAAKDAGATWATTFANMKAAATRGWVEVIESLDTALASKGLPSTMEMVASFGATMENVLSSVGDNIGAVVGVAAGLFNVVGAAGGFIADNWAFVEPILVAVAAALGIYTAALVVHKGIVLAAAAAEGILTLAAGMKAAFTSQWTVATFVQTVAQEGLNAALYACPLVWIIGLIIVAITVIYLVVAAINKAQNKTISATGVIVGALAAAGAFIWNSFSALYNGVISLFAGLWNFIAGFANFFSNVFRDPIGAAAHLFASFGETVLNLISSIAGAIDSLFGTEFVSRINGWIDDLHGWADTKGDGKYQEDVRRINPQDYYLDRKSYSGAYKAGYKWGSSAGDKIKNLTGGKGASGATAGDIPSEVAKGVGNIDKNTGKIKDSVQSTSEDLKLLRELAERQAINKFTTASVKIDMSGMTNQLNSDRDIDGTINVLTKKLENALVTSGEGVHI